MAAPGRRASSSSDDEELQRCRDAVWETQADQRKDGGRSVRPSKRVVVADRDHEGNQLQVTRGFQAHVAKKLQHFLDSCISEMQSKTSRGLESTNCGQDDHDDQDDHDEQDDQDDHDEQDDQDDQDEGFRLFSTSVPGQKADRPPAPARRRPAPSSSDSDAEMEARLKEAAVSLKDLLPSSARPSPPTADAPSSEETLTESRVMKKEKKEMDEEGEHSAGPAQSSGERRSSGHAHVTRKTKQKQTETPS